MRKNKPKIRIASPEEVAEYTSDSSTQQEDSPAVESAVTGEPASEERREPKDELTTLREQVAEVRDKFLRAKAEAQNIARRAQQEKGDAIRYGNAELLKALLAVVDDFERTLEAAADIDQAQAVIDGVKLVYDKLMKLLKDSSVEVIEALGKPFDPTEHAAVMQQLSADQEPGTVIQEVVRGYRHRDRILRPVQVVVAKAENES